MRRFTHLALSLATVAGIVTVAASASAETSPLQISADISGGSVTITTDRLPKGWFSSKNLLDANKSYVVVDYSLSATSCSTSQSGSVSTLGKSGWFMPVTNPQGKVDGYILQIPIDLSGLQNHWNNHLHCDQSTHVHGCTDAAGVCFKATAYAANGSCHAYTADDGSTQCASWSDAGVLDAVQDADTAETDCCDPEQITVCEGACNQACNDTIDCKPAQDIADEICKNDPKGKPSPACVTAKDAFAACNKSKGECHSGCNCQCLATTPGCTPCE